jgi:lysophospholipase L1-like esterase
MRKIKMPTRLGYILLLLITLPNEIAVAQNKPQGVTETSKTTFDLKNGDRVVFLGNSLFENDLRYGYLELALTTRWPNRDVTYRNIGWTGDTVFGEARSNISSPSAYDLLLEQLTKAQPTIVFIAYGAIEAFDGETGLSRFIQGLNQLLDKVDQLGAKAILLSPIPMMSAGSSANLAKRNAMLELYASAIAKIASDRGKHFIDIFNPLLERNKNAKLSDNGLHLNENGYYYLASTIEKGLGLAPRNVSAVINVSKHAVEAMAPVKILDSDKNNGNIKFTIDEGYLPLPLPEQGGEIADNARILRIPGLKKGFYTLTIDDSEVITASEDKWKEGVEINQGASFSQAVQLREKIIKKNELFFHQYRPLNRTYIIGFRSHEQGRHAKGLEELSIIITWLEGQIDLNGMPKSKIYQLTRIK